jgi:hypothetical protein
MTVRKEIIEFRDLTHETQYIVYHVFNAQDFDVHSNNVSLKCSSFFLFKVFNDATVYFSFRIKENKRKQNIIRRMNNSVSKPLTIVNLK